MQGNDHHIRRLLKGGMVLLLTLSLILIWQRALNSKDAPVTPVYLSCTAKGANADAICAYATRSIAQILATSKGLDPNLDPQQTGAILSSKAAPKPLPLGAALIGIDAIETRRGMRLTITLSTTDGPQKTVENGLTVMDYKSPNAMGLYRRFLDKVIPTTLEIDRHR